MTYAAPHQAGAQCSETAGQASLFFGVSCDRRGPSDAGNGAAFALIGLDFSEGLQLWNSLGDGMLDQPEQPSVVSPEAELTSTDKSFNEGEWLVKDMPQL